MPDTVAIKIDILVNKRFSEGNGYNLIQTVFKNLIAIKSVGSDDYKLQMRDFNPEYIYLSNNNHKAVLLICKSNWICIFCGLPPEMSMQSQELIVLQEIRVRIWKKMCPEPRLLATN